MSSSSTGCLPFPFTFLFATGAATNDQPPAPTRKEKTLIMALQQIYDAALAKPKGGFKRSPKFRRSLTNCPECGLTTWLRIRHKTGTVIGVTCGSCSWRTTYLQKPELPNAPSQGELL